MPMPKKSDPAKSCESCGKALQRKRYCGRMEDRAVFLRRRFCDAKCMGTSKVTATPARGTLRKRTGKAVPLKPACERCGSAKERQRHHRNRDIADNRPENVETLCARCHALEHWATDKPSTYRAKYPADYLDGVEAA